MPYVYMVRCEDGSLYTGITTDVPRRMKEHYDRKRPGAKYTKSRRISALEMVWETDTWSHAAKLEYRIKRLAREEKEALIGQPQSVQERFKESLEGILYEPRPDWKSHPAIRELWEKE